MASSMSCEQAVGGKCYPMIYPPTQRCSTTFVVGKLVKGRKRHLVVDTQGLLLGVAITEANTQDPLGRSSCPARGGL